MSVWRKSWRVGLVAVGSAGALFAASPYRRRLTAWYFVQAEKKPIRVLVTGAAGQIAYSLVYMVAKGDMFGADQPIILHLLDIDACKTALGGVAMELEDCAFPLLKNVVTTSNPDEAFAQIDVALLVGAFPRKEGQERKDLLKANASIFKVHGNALDTLAKKSVRVLVVGNPANTNCWIARHYAPSLKDENFSCLTRLDQNRGYAQVAARCGVEARDVENVIIWGNHSTTQFPDVSHATVNLRGQRKAARDAIKDDEWTKHAFVTTVQKRGGAVIAARKLSSAMSAAKAICDHMHDWHFGTPTGRFVSMGVPSDGSYGIDKGLVYSFPVRIGTDGQYHIVKDLPIDGYARGMMDASKAELLEERVIAEQIVQSNS